MEKTIKDVLALLESNSISKETAFELIEAEILAEHEFLKQEILRIAGDFIEIQKKLKAEYENRLNVIYKQVEALKK